MRRFARSARGSTGSCRVVAGAQRRRTRFSGRAGRQVQSGSRDCAGSTAAGAQLTKRWSPGMPCPKSTQARRRRARHGDRPRARTRRHRVSFRRTTPVACSTSIRSPDSMRCGNSICSANSAANSRPHGPKPQRRARRVTAFSLRSLPMWCAPMSICADFKFVPGSCTRRATCCASRCASSTFAMSAASPTNST